MIIQPFARNSQGFTLLETIIYIALTAVFLTSIVTAAYPFISGAERLSSNVVVDSEVAFILRKISWMLNAGGPVTIPNSVSGPGSTLTVTVGASNITLTLSGDQLMISEGVGTPLPINSSRVPIQNFSVSYVPAVVLPIPKPKAIDITFTAKGKIIGPETHYARF